MKKLVDTTHHYAGYWKEGGICQLQVYREEEGEPENCVIVLTELPENQNTSVINMVTWLAAEAVMKYYPQGLGPEGDGKNGAPFTIVQHDLPTRYIRTKDEYATVTFASVRPKKDYYSHGGIRYKFGGDSFQYLDEAEFFKMIGGKG